MNANPLPQERKFGRLLLIFFLFSLALMNPLVHGDGVGYYAYARAPLIEHSLDFTHDYQFAHQVFREDHVDANGQPKPAFRTRTGHLENHFTVGPAILWAPFLLLAHLGILVARIFGSSIAADGFSAPYRYAMASATAFYGFLGLFLSYRLARKYTEPIWAFLATTAIWWASSLPVYMYFNPSWSHAHSCFTVALFLWFWDDTREQRTLFQWVVLGMIVGLMLNVYYANLMIVTVLLVEALPQYVRVLRSSRARSADVSQLLKRHLLFGFVVGAILLPTILSRWVIYGSPLETGYVALKDWLWRSPVFLEILFSANHGLLSWTPLIAFSILGVVFFAVRLPRVGVPLLVATGSFYLLLSFYPDWAGISSFGNRFFISLTPIFILGLAIFLQSLATHVSRPRIAVLIAVPVLACFVFWNLGLIYQWGTHLIPPRGPISFQEATYNQFHVVPKLLSAHLRSYVFRRGDFMQQIEEKDREQLNKSAQP